MTPNRLGQENCTRCGTPLMLIVETSAARFDMSYSQTHGQEYLLERISWLELRMMQLVGKLEHTLNLMLQQSNNIYFDHTLLDALITVLTKDNTIDIKELNDLWKANRNNKNIQDEKVESIEKYSREWLEEYIGEEKEKFKDLIDKSSVYFLKGDFKKGVKFIERASVLSPDHESLNLFLAVTYFRSRRTALARDYFLRLYKKTPNEPRLALGLALCHCEEGEIKEAREILTKYTRKKSHLFALHYAYGRLLIAEENWSEAIKQFKKALEAKPISETHYVLACAYYCVDKIKLAEKHLQTAIELDASYAGIFYLYGLILLKKGETEKAEQCFHQAVILNTEDKHYDSALKNIKKLSDKKIIPPLFASLLLSKKKLITSGDERLTQLVWKEALNDSSK